MSRLVPALAALAICLAGCAGVRFDPPPPAALVEPLPLPFKGRLEGAAPSEVPAAVAAALSDSSPITFHYREELSHDRYTVALWLSALDPLTYFGYPLGNYQAIAFASLSITEDGRVLGDYTARVRVTGDYTIYSGPTYRELDRRARQAVRQMIDEALSGDGARLARGLQAPSEPR